MKKNKLLTPLLLLIILFSSCMPSPDTNEKIFIVYKIEISDNDVAYYHLTLENKTLKSNNYSYRYLEFKYVDSIGKFKVGDTLYFQKQTQ